MATLLVIDASARRERSLSRKLSETFVASWLRERPGDRVLRRDVGTEHPPLLTEAWIAACFTPDAKQTPEQRQVLAYSDAVIDEVARADVIVVATPRYNYGMPAALKAWFDQVIRIRRTFSFDPNEKMWPLAPLLSGKTLVVLTASGEFGFHPGGVRADWDHLLPHLRTCARYLGVASENVHHIAVEYQEFGDDRHDASMTAALQAAAAMAPRLARIQQA